MANENIFVIKTYNLSKKYKLYTRSTDRLRESLSLSGHKYHSVFEALSEINIEIKKGQTIGIIGKNGSGKSTLLKIITGIITPTSGSVEVKGKISSLLELGAGFNPDLSGYDNIFLNGYLLGLTDFEIEKKIKSIIDFADIGDFLYQPVRMYSSGMFARLAFSVAISSDPDLLIVDEALSVGDIFFQAKCYNYFQKLQDAGKTVLFVTHSLDTVIRNCNYAFCLNQGRLVAKGSPKDVVDFYKKIDLELNNELTNSSQNNRLEFKTKLSNSYKLNDVKDDYGNHKALIEDFAILNRQGVPLNIFSQGEQIEIILKINVQKVVTSLIAAFAIKTADGLELIGTNTHIEKISMQEIIENKFGAVRFKFPLDIQSGEYLLSLGLTYYDDNGDLKVYHRMYNIISFFVQSRINGTGICSPKIAINIESSKNE